MRIILLSIAFLFLAFSAHSQVLKSAGVWYFLDVDSMTARPAVLPNGTELAYVVGTKTVYYWNRATSTWTAYGSTFNRDSIYFDASIVGGGTVSDPWGVDSTLFATIAAVGDSIAAAVANYFPLEGGTLTGTGGAGFIGLPAQSGTPSTPASGFRLFANGAHNLAILDRNGWITTFDISAIANRDFTYPSTGGTFALGTGTADRSARWSATNTLAAGNITDNGTKLQALLPWQFQTYTTAGLPSGVTGYHVYNTTTNGPGWYQGSRWAYGLESTFNRGTDKRFAVFDANGQVINSHVQLRGTNAAFSVYIGNLAGNTATGTYNTALGEEALKVASGTSNTGIGAYALYSNVGGIDNVALGVNTLYSNISGSRNIAIGRNSQLTATGASGNVSMGYEALRNNTGSNNFALGNDALRVNTANLNFALGNSALNVNSSGTENTAIGASSMITNTIGSYNTGIGGSSLRLNLSGNYNVGIGIRSIYSNSTGQYNIGIGTDALYNTTGSFNVGIGPNVGYRSTSGSNNVFIGYNAFYATGSNGAYSNNVAIGYEVARNVTTGADNNIIIGNSISLPTAGGDNQLVIGNAIFGTGLTGTGTTAAGKISILKPAPDYVFDVTSSDAFGFPRGTVAQRPTIVSSTTPMRFNTDSTALEYGESVGMWRLLSTRSYARSLVSGLSPDTWLGTRLNAGNVDINANGHEFRIDSLSAFIVSAESTATLGGAAIEQVKWLNTAKTKYYNRRLHYDSRAGISGGMPAFYNLLTVNKGSGEGYEWANEMIWDTTNNVFLYGYGGRYSVGYLKFNGTRSNSTGVYLSVPRFHFFGTNAAENATADTYHTIWGESSAVSEMLMGLKDGGKFLIASDSTFIFDPTLDVPQFNKMGQGNKEASDLSKTQSAYIAGFATDGTLLDYPISGLGNGIYSGSATLANHTTRARVPDDGNLFFSQTYNGGADSSFFYFANATSGERYVGLGMTDTASTGGASLLFGNDGAGEMSFELQTIDAVNGNTQIRGVSGDLNMSSSAGNISLSTNVANEVRVTGLVRAKQEAYYEITSTSSPQTFSNDYSDNFVNQGSTQATFTFLFPASPEDGQILSVTWNNAISVLTLDGNGNTITGTAVTTAVAGTRRQFKYYASASAWIKIY